MGCHFLLQGIFPTQGLNLDFLYFRQTFYRLSHQGSHIPYSAWDILIYLKHYSLFIWNSNLTKLPVFYLGPFLGTLSSQEAGILDDGNDVEGDDGGGGGDYELGTTLSSLLGWSLSILTSFMRKILFLPIVQMKEWVSICKEIALNHPANKSVIWDLNQCPCNSKVPAFNHSSGLVASAEQAQLLDLWRISSPKLCGKLGKRIKIGWWACWCQKWELPPPVSCLLGGASPLNGESRAQEARLKKRVIIFFLHFFCRCTSHAGSFLVLRPGAEVLPAVEAQNLNTGPPGKFPSAFSVPYMRWPQRPNCSPQTWFFSLTL